VAENIIQSISARHNRPGVHLCHSRKLGSFSREGVNSHAAYVLCVFLLATAATSFSSLPLTAADRTLTELTERRFAASHLL
jgi:hypothetical protein